MQLLIFLNGKKSSAGGRHRIAPVPTAASLIINSSWGKMTTPSKSVSISAFSLSCSVCVTMGKSISKAWHINLKLALRQITLLSSERKLFDCGVNQKQPRTCAHIFVDMLKNAADAFGGRMRLNRNCSTWESTSLEFLSHLGEWKWEKSGYSSISLHLETKRVNYRHKNICSFE